MAARNQGTSSSGSDDVREERKPYGYISAICVGAPSGENDGRTNDKFVSIGTVWENKGGSLNVVIDSWPLAWRREMPAQIKFHINLANKS